MQETILKYLADRGRMGVRLKAYSLIPQEIEKEKESIEAIIGFMTSYLPEKLREEGIRGFKITDYNRDNLKDVHGNELESYKFRINTLRKSKARVDDVATFSSKEELVKNLDLGIIKKILTDPKIEIIGIDESKIDVPYPGSSIAYLKTVAYRLYTKDGQTYELVGPLLEQIRIKPSESEKFEKENAFLSYIHNMFIIYLSILTSIVQGYRPVVFLHGPLVRPIGGFTDLHFDYKTLTEVFSVTESAIKELDLPENWEDIGLDTDTIQKLKSIRVKTPKDVLNYFIADNWISEFHQIELENARKIYRTPDLRTAWKNMLPRPVNSKGEWESKDIPKEEREYPALNLYLWMLKKLFELSKIFNVPIIACVDNISASTEITKHVIPSLFRNTTTVVPKKIKDILREKFKVFPRSSSDPAEFYKYIFNLLDVLNVPDYLIFTLVLNEAEYTSPIPTYRYLTRQFFEDNFGHGYYGIRNIYQPIIDFYFPITKKRILVSYLRTTPLREPIRLEFFDIYHNPESPKYTEWIGATYLLGLLYESYGLPIVLYYADKVARTHKSMIESLVQSSLLEILIESLRNEPNINPYFVFSLVTKLGVRNFFKR